MADPKRITIIWRKYAEPGSETLEVLKTAIQAAGLGEMSFRFAFMEDGVLLLRRKPFSKGEEKSDLEKLWDACAQYGVEYFYIEKSACEQRFVSMDQIIRFSEPIKVQWLDRRTLMDVLHHQDIVLNF